MGAAPETTNRHGHSAPLAESSQRTYRQEQYFAYRPREPRPGQLDLQLVVALQRLLLSSCCPPLAFSEFCDVSIVYPNPCLYISTHVTCADHRSVKAVRCHRSLSHHP